MPMPRTALRLGWAFTQVTKLCIILQLKAMHGHYASLEELIIHSSSLTRLAVTYDVKH